MVLEIGTFICLEWEVEGDRMKVKELITELSGEDQEAEVGWEVGSKSLDLLIGEDADTGLSITIPKPNWS